jgi:hypothetical protein
MHKMASQANIKSKDQFGELLPRYSLILNPYKDTRLSKCPICERPTHPRKFPLVVYIEDWGPLVLGKTCRYCARCELIILHQDELEFELATCMERLSPEMIGNKYLVLGTMEKKTWQQGLRAAFDAAELRKYMADFKQYYDLKMEGGWRPA